MTTPPAPIPRDDLIICPRCDAAYTLVRPQHGHRAVCHRCHTVLIMPHHKAGKQIIALSIAIVILIITAAVFPFLSVAVAGARNSVSVLDAALIFGDGPLLILSLATVGVIILIPLTRVLLSLYVLVPIVRDRPPARHAAVAFRLAEALRPWSMTEIFAIGCAVALVKVSDLADVTLGPAFWLFAILVVLVVVQDNLICRWTVWNALSKKTKS
ncbi:paraquat-inducible protein A [Roseobacter sp.]|uniref:paraquat-inducible protein A n=1 Tax=Roseobacter sp. TaxID=1907202 RepID=UPI003297CDF6